MLMDPLSIFGEIVNNLTAPIDAVSGLFNSITGVSDSWKTMTGTGDTSSIKQSKNLMDYQMENQKKLMQFGNDLQLAQWNRENAYNAPTAQLERLKQAGLNPLFHGLDGNASGGLSAVSAPSAPDLGSILNAVGASMQMRIQQMQARAQIGLIDAEKKKTEQETENLKTEGSIKKVDLRFREADGEFWLDDKYMTDENGRVGYFTADGEFIPITDQSHPGYSQNYLYKNSQYISQFTDQVNSLKEELDKLRRDNRLGDLRERNFETLVANELRKSNADADTAEWAASQAQIIFYNLITEGKQKTFDLSVDTDVKETERKLGLVGEAVRIISHAIRGK